MQHREHCGYSSLVVEAGKRLLGVVVVAAAVWSCADNGGSGTPDQTASSDVVSDVDEPDGTSVGNHAPELDRIGNRRAPIGKPLDIVVSATDPDGDALTYSVFGDLPVGSKFAKETHTFEWTPQAADDGKLVILTFAVSDGAQEDRETIQITVTTSDESTKPVIQEVGDVFVGVGEAYELRLQATDEDGDALTFSTGSALPTGAVLDGKTGVMKWTPTPDQDGMTFSVVFMVSDGEFEATSDARFLVQSAQLTFEPIPLQEVKLNETLTLPLPITNPMGFKIQCEAIGTLPTGATFDVPRCTLTYTPTDPSLVGTSKQFDFRVTSTGGGVDYNLIGSATVFVIGDTVQPQCTADGFEPNDFSGEATLMVAGVYTGLTVCGDEDWYRVVVADGGALQVDLRFVHGPNQDIDVYVYGPDLVEALVVGDSATNNESVTASNLAAGTYTIRAFEFSDGDHTYEMTITVTESLPSCTNDSHEPNESFSSASSLGPGASHFVDDGMICPADVDWYAFGGVAGNSLSAMLVFDNSVGDLDLELYDAANTLVAWSRLTTDEETITHTFATSGDFRLKVFGYQNASAAYLLDIATSGGPPCDAMSCAAAMVCGNAGGCVAESCVTDADCPNAYRCRQGHCVDPCVADSTCRTNLGYGCRTLTATDAVAFCAPSGSGASGSACSSMATCRADSACLVGSRFPNGYCAMVGCFDDLDCDLDTTCVEVDGIPMCLQFCLASTDCRAGEGYTCTPLPMVGASGDIEVCVK